MVGEGLEPPKLKTPDLQSGPFAALETHLDQNMERGNRTPASRFGDGSSTIKLFPRIRNSNASLRTALVRFERTTQRLTVACNYHCATGQDFSSISYSSNKSTIYKI